MDPSLPRPRGVLRLQAMLENWLGYMERIVFRGGRFFAAASAEFDSRPGGISAGFNGHGALGEPDRELLGSRHTRATAQGDEFPAIADLR